MSAHTRRVGRLTLVPILVFSAQVGVTSQHPTTAKPTPPAAQTKPAPVPAADTKHAPSVAPQPGSKPAPGNKSTPPPQTHSATPAPAGKPPAGKPLVATPALGSQLKVALDRIQQRVAATVGPAATPQIAPHFPGLAKGPAAIPAVKTPALVTAAAPPPAAVPVPAERAIVVAARAAVPATPRIQLSWRSSLAWPATLTGAANAAPPAARRLILIWR